MENDENMGHVCVLCHTGWIYVILTHSTPMAKEQQTTQKWMGDQKKLAKPVSWQNTKLSRQKSQEENPNQPKTGETTRDWLTPGYGKEPSISPWEGHQKKNGQTRTQ